MDEKLLTAFEQALMQRYPERKPTESELGFFRKRPSVAGYAAEDRSVVLNPLSPVFQDPKGQRSVLMNERVRQYLKDTKADLAFDIAPHQQQFFEGIAPEYAQDPALARQTIMARILAGDPSAGPYTPQQTQAAHGVLMGFFK